ncbi:MAG: hypothetical protein CMJ52_08105 [Planctomycetaceae bacterium]|nr:hypothetical protein [Planctomycetaceae bacterium]
MELVLEPLELPAEPHHLQLALLLLSPRGLLRVLQLGKFLLKSVNFPGEFLLLPLIVGPCGQEALLGVLLILELIF